jgi:hypothetical protein
VEALDERGLPDPRGSGDDQEQSLVLGLSHDPSSVTLA